MKELLHKELCYRINGAAFEVDNSIGHGFSEKIYQKAFEEALIRRNISYKKEVYFPLKIGDKVIAKKYFDFITEDKIVVEIKRGTSDYRNVCNQVFQYLKISKLKLGLVIRFTRDGVKIKRIPNIRD